jgi:hypothetical protein
MTSQGIRTHCSLALNIYLDGSWKTSHPKTTPSSQDSSSSKTPILTERNDSPIQRSVNDAPTAPKPAPRPLPLRGSMPEKRYLGAFGVTAWATKSGLDCFHMGRKLASGGLNPQHQVQRWEEGPRSYVQLPTSDKISLSASQIRKV